MKISLYLKDKSIYILCYISVILFITLLLYLFDSHIILIVFIPLFLLILGLFLLLLEYFKKAKFYNKFCNSLNSLDKKYLITEVIDSCDFYEGMILLDSLYEIDKSYAEEVNKYKYKMEDFKDYIELWCHEIKTPIAISKLILENKKNNDIEDELNKIEYYIEQVLYYARSENVEKDYIINKIDLKNIIDNVIKSNKKLLINKKVKIDNMKDTVWVYSDSKWLEFIINQIIINSIKYFDKSPRLSFSYKKNQNNIILTIEDNGIGINATDICHVFEKGFTGSNGRKKSNATGMGLYLCKTLCTKLGHEIKIISKENEYTKVLIVFPISSMIGLKEK